MVNQEKSTSEERHARPPRPQCAGRRALEVEAQLHCFGARGHVVRAAECGKEIVQRHFVGQVDDREAQAPLVPVTMEKVVIAHAGIKQAARLDALRIVVVIFLADAWDLDVDGSEPRCVACRQCRPRGAWSSKLAVACESRLKLLIGSQRQSREVVHESHLAGGNIGASV
jgi:hypothetical protein